MAALLCQGLGIFSPQLDLEAPSTKSWKPPAQGPGFMPHCWHLPGQGWSWPGSLHHHEPPAPQSYGRALRGPRLLSRVQLSQGLPDIARQPLSPPQISMQPDPRLGLPAPERSPGLVFTCLSTLVGCGLLEGMFY